MFRSLATSSWGRAIALRRVLALMLLLGLLLAGLPPASALAATCQVTTTTNDGGAGSLRALVANPGCATITFATGISQVPLVQPLEIARSVTILGAGADKLALVHVGPPGGIGIPGFPIGNVLTIRAGTVDLRGLTITGGLNLGSWGGGLTVIGAPGAPVNLTLNGVVVDRNAALGGGGIYASNASLLLYDTTLSNNGAATVSDPSYGGGGLFLDDYWGSASAYLVRPTVIGNGAGDNEGGGIRVWHRASVGYARLTVVDGTIGTAAQPNTARIGGGVGINGAQAFLLDSTIGGNRAVGTATGFDDHCATNRACGGGVHVSQRGAATVTRSTVSGNQATWRGGGLYSENGTLTLDGTTISGNRADRGAGLSSEHGTARLTNSTVSGNHKDSRWNVGFGSGLDFSASTASLKLVTVTGNTGGDAGLVTLYGPSGSLTVQGSIIAGNIADGGRPGDCASPDAADLVSLGYNLWGNQTACPNNAAGGDRNLPALGLNITAVLNTTLADNGGPTKTHNLVATGPAVNKGGTADCPATDQRGVARPQGSACDIGAVELAYVTLTVTLQGPQVITTSNGYPTGTVVTLPSDGGALIITGWTIDSQFVGWAQPLTIAMNGNHTAVASFGSLSTFADARANQTGATEAIAQLAARGIVKGCDQEANLFCPTDPTLRAQMAALIVRALGWGGENPANPFPDRNGVDDELWRAVAILADHGVAKGYGDGTYGTTSPVLNAQVISFITRAMVNHGYWTMQPDDGRVYPNVAAASGHRQDLVTYIHYAGAVRGATDTTGTFEGWDQPSSRAYFAFALWQALDSYFSVDRVPERVADAVVQRASAVTLRAMAPALETEAVTLCVGRIAPTDVALGGPEAYVRAHLS